MRTSILAIAFAVAAVAATPVLASEEKSCTAAPKDQWQSADQLTGKLAEQGYKVAKVEFEDGCAEVKGTDKDGKKVELYVDPVTAAIVKIDD